jgi:hypothetical protein
MRIIGSFPGMHGWLRSLAVTAVRFRHPSGWELFGTLLQVPQLGQCLRLDTGDPLSGDAQPLAHLLDGALPTIDEPEAQLEDAPLARRQSGEDILDIDAERRRRRLVERRRRH